MAPGEHQANDFIPYPVNRVVGTIADSTQARATIEALLQRGIDAASIDVLYGDTGLHRLDPDGALHGFWAGFSARWSTRWRSTRSRATWRVTWTTWPPATSSSWCKPATSERARKSPRRCRQAAPGT